MHHSLRMVAAIGSLGWATMALIPIGYGSGLGPVRATQSAGRVDQPNLPDVFVEKSKDCVSEYGKQLEPGNHRFDSKVEVDEDGVKWGVTIGGIPDTAPELAACLRVALANMPIADEPFRQGVETLKYRRQEALAEQKKLMGHPIVIVVAGVTIVVGEVMLEAGAITILTAVSVELIDKASKDVAEMAKRRRPSCLDHYVACVASKLYWEQGMHIRNTRCNLCRVWCANNNETWPSQVPHGDGYAACNY